MALCGALVVSQTIKGDLTQLNQLVDVTPHPNKTKME